MTISAGMSMRASARSNPATSNAGVRQRVNVEIDQRAGGVFDGGEALIEGARRQHAVEQRLRHRLAGRAWRAYFSRIAGTSSQCS